MKKVDKTQQASRDHRKQVETFTVKSRLYVDALSSSEKYSDDSETSEPSIPTSDTSLENKDIWFYKTDKEDHFNWEKMIILTWRCFHDDCVRIIETLREWNDVIDYFHLFHADKAILTIRDTKQACPLCLNDDWVTVGTFTVKFKNWSPQEHAKPKFIPSYGGWLRFRGIPLHAWNIHTFEQIGFACGGLLDISFNTWRKFDLTEVVIKVRENYCGFIPAEIKIITENKEIFTVHMVVTPRGKWLTKKHPSIYGTFSREAAATFDFSDPNAETFHIHDGVARAFLHDNPKNSEKINIAANRGKREGKSIVIEEAGDISHGEDTVEKRWAQTNRKKKGSLSLLQSQLPYFTNHR